MTESMTLPSPPSLGVTSGRQRFELALLAIGLLVMYVPTYIALDEKIWSIVGQGHGPVMLALTLWLIWQRAPTLSTCAAPTMSANLVGTASLILGLAIYIVGRSQAHFGLHVGSQMFVMAALLLLYWGWDGMRKMWFPLAFSITLVPLPGSLVDAVTGPLKAYVSVVSEYILYHLGYPIGRSGVTLTIGPYQLLVADACAGLNSIFALEAITIFYMSIVQHTSKLRNVILAILVLPISFLSNVTRVVTLVLVTYYLGDEVGQGFTHSFAGILLFMVATFLTISVDNLLGFFFKNSPAPQEPRAQTQHT